MAESEVIQQASRIVGLVMGGSSIEDAMEEVIGPGDWSEQATELADLIEQAAAEQFDRVEDAFYEKTRFAGENCGIGSEGFQPGNKCGAKRGKGGAKPKGSTPRKPRKKAEPAAEAPASPEAPDSKPKRGRKPKATPAATAALKPRAPRAKKPKPKPSALQRGREVIHNLSKAFKKFRKDTLKALAKKIKATRKAVTGSPKSITKKVQQIRGRSEQKRKIKELKTTSHETHRKLVTARQDAANALAELQEKPSIRSDPALSAMLHKISRDVYEARLQEPSATPAQTPAEADFDTGGDTRRTLQKVLTSKAIGDLANATKKIAGSTESSKISRALKSLASSMTEAQRTIDQWKKMEAKKFMRVRIEDKFYFDSNCGTGAGGFKPGNKCGGKDGKASPKADGKGAAKSTPKKPSPAQRRATKGQKSTIGDRALYGLTHTNATANHQNVVRLDKKIASLTSRETGIRGVDAVRKRLSQSVATLETGLRRASSSRRGGKELTMEEVNGIVKNRRKIINEMAVLNEHSAVAAKKAKNAEAAYDAAEQAIKEAIRVTKAPGISPQQRRAAIADLKTHTATSKSQKARMQQMREIMQTNANMVRAIREYLKDEETD